MIKNISVIEWICLILMSPILITGFLILLLVSSIVAPVTWLYKTITKKM